MWQRHPNMRVTLQTRSPAPTITAMSSMMVCVVVSISGHDTLFIMLVVDHHHYNMMKLKHQDTYLVYEFLNCWCASLRSLIFNSHQLINFIIIIMEVRLKLITIYRSWNTFFRGKTIFYNKNKSWYYFITNFN